MTETESIALKNIRFPLIVLVVLVHTNLGVHIDSHFYSYFERFFRSFSHMAVPTFFLISGYLFFKSVNKCTCSIYKSKIKRRIPTLLVPYLLWNLLYLLFLLLLQVYAPSLVSNERKRIVDYTFGELLNSFWNFGGVYYGMPILYSFWYIRDLIVMCICSPIIYWAIKKLGALYLCALSLVFVFNPFSFKATDMDWVKAVFFFSFGAWLGINKKSFQLPNRLVLLISIIWSFTIIMKVFVVKTFWSNQILLIVSALVLPILFTWYTKCYKKESSNSLASSVMFVYGFHLFCIMLFNKYWNFLLPVNGLTASIALLTIPLLTSYFCVFVYYISKKMMPVFVGILTGGR